VGRVAFLAAHAVSWWAVAGVVAVMFGILLFRLLAERERRKTLETTYRYAPAGTVVELGDGPGGPPMCIHVGEGHRPELPAVVTCEHAGHQRRPGRRE
jgi:hypothetical protein